MAKKAVSKAQAGLFGAVAGGADWAEEKSKGLSKSKAKKKLKGIEYATLPEHTSTVKRGK